MYVLLIFLLSPSSLATTNLFSVSTNFLRLLLFVLVCHTVKIVLFIVSVSLAYLPDSVNYSFILSLFQALTFHLPAGGYLGCFQVLTIINKTAANIHFQVHLGILSTPLSKKVVQLLNL